MTQPIPTTRTSRLLRINEVAAETGMTTRRIRYYEEIGLLEPAARSDGDYRLYDASDLDRLQFIRSLRDDAGFSLAQIGQLLEDEAARERNRERLRQTTDPAERRLHPCRCPPAGRAALLTREAKARPALASMLDDAQRPLRRVRAHRGSRSRHGPDDLVVRRSVPGSCLVSRHRTGHHDGRRDPRWLLKVLGVTSVGALLAALTSGTLVIALPEILRDLTPTSSRSCGSSSATPSPPRSWSSTPAGSPTRSAGWAPHCTLPVLFTLASVACALAPTAFLLIVARLVQGVGGAFLMANSAALVTDAFPRRELGRALGINAMVVGAGLILGPILGGWLTGFGWQTVFWFNVPIGVVGTIAAATLLVEQGRRAEGRMRLDLAGSALYLIGLSGLVTALTFGGIYGWTTTWVLAGFAAFIVAMPAFLWVEAHHDAPLLDLSLFRNRLFALGNLTGLLNGIARNGVLFLLVFYLQGARGYDPVTAGLALAPLAVGLLVLSPISGALADRIGSRLLATAGMIVTAVGLLGLTTIAVDTPYWQLAVWES